MQANSTSLQTDNHTSTSYLQAGCSSCHPNNNVKALKAIISQWKRTLINKLLWLHFVTKHFVNSRAFIYKLHKIKTNINKWLISTQFSEVSIFGWNGLSHIHCKAGKRNPLIFDYNFVKYQFIVIQKKLLGSYFFLPHSVVRYCALLKIHQCNHSFFIHTCTFIVHFLILASCHFIC